MVIEPNGYAIWEKMKEILDKKFKELGHVNVAMPVFIPENLLKKEGELVNGFAPEVAWITHGGSKELEERLAQKVILKDKLESIQKRNVLTIMI